MVTPLLSRWARALIDRRHGLVAIAVLAAACSDPVHPPEGTRPDFPQPTLPAPLTAIAGRIAFVSTRDGSEWIYVADSTSIRRLAPGDEPAWSPDGSTIAYSSPGGIALMNGDGGNMRLIRMGGSQPVWSPDGKQIAFTDGGLRVMEANGTSERLLVSDDFHQEGDGLYRPDWSTDGQRLAFMLYDCCWLWPVEIWVVGLDGGPPAKVIDGVPDPWGGRVWLSHWAPAWSPDGETLAFIYDFGISTIVPGAETPSKLAVTAAYESDLAWSPDGRSLVYTEYSVEPSGPFRQPSGPLRLYIFNFESGQVRPLLPEAAAAANPAYWDNHAVWGRDPS